MAVQIIPKEKQGQGAFNNGEIIENKPVGFPQDRSTTRPFSNLFYWAHAKAMTDSTIGLHPHQGFEICSFILKGPVRHYDTKLKQWQPLESGDVQIIRAGNGISHSEFMGEGSEMFQIWFDPNLAKTLSQPASYDDYRDGAFPIKTTGNAKVKTLVGPDSPFAMDTPNVEVYRINMTGGSLSFEAGDNKICAAYLLSGSAKFNGETAQQFDFVLANDTDTLTIAAETEAEVFLMKLPASPGYRTYAQRMA